MQEQIDYFKTKSIKFDIADEEYAIQYLSYNTYFLS